MNEFVKKNQLQATKGFCKIKTSNLTKFLFICAKLSSFDAKEIDKITNNSGGRVQANATTVHFFGATEYKCDCS